MRANHLRALHGLDGRPRSRSRRKRWVPLQRSPAETRTLARRTTKPKMYSVSHGTVLYTRGEWKQTSNFSPTPGHKSVCRHTSKSSQAGTVTSSMLTSGAPRGCTSMSMAIYHQVELAIRRGKERPIGGCRRASLAPRFTLPLFSPKSSLYRRRLEPGRNRRAKLALRQPASWNRIADWLAQVDVLQEPA